MSVRSTFLLVGFFGVLSLVSSPHSPVSVQQSLAQGPPISVESADPPEGEQETLNLDVTIKGKGFRQGYTAHFLVTGTENPGGIVVTNTRFVDSRTLVSTVDIPATADLGSFDIEVRSNGRRGKGIDLFKVVEKGGGGGHDNGNQTGAVPATFEFFDDGSSTIVTGDGDGPYVTVEGQLNAIIMGSGNPSLEIAGVLQDPAHRTLVVELNPSEPGCDAPPYFIDIGGDGTVNVNSDMRLWFNNMRATPSGEGYLPIPSPGENVVPNEPFRGLEVGARGYTVVILRFLARDPRDGQDYKWSVVAGNQNDNSPGTDRVEVTRVGAYEWTVTGLGDSTFVAKVTRSFEVPFNKKKTRTVTDPMGLCSARISLRITELPGQ